MTKSEFLDRQYGVHERTGPYTDLKDHPWGFRCNKPWCFYGVSTQTKEQAEHQQDHHGCPNQVGTTHIAGDVTMTLVGTLWGYADTAFGIKQALEEKPAEEQATPEWQAKHNVVRGKLIGYADCIVLFMRPHFPDAKAVAAELATRYAKMLNGEEYETRGLNSRRYELPTESPRKQLFADPGRKAEPIEHNLSPEDVESIRKAKGVFLPAQLARTYGTSVRVIQEIFSN